MKKLLSLFLLIGGILVLCLSFRFSKEAEAKTAFPENKALQGRVIPIDTALFKYPWRIRVNGDRAVVEDLHGPDYFFHLFSYPDFRYLSSFSKRGEGPEEMLQAENFRWEGESVWTLDGNKSEMVQWQFNTRRDSLLRHRVVKLQKELFRALDFTIYSGTRFLIPDYSGDNRFCWVDRQGKLIRKTGTIPSSNKKALQESRHALAYAWRSFIDYNPRNGVLVAATQLGDVLEVYNLKKNTHVVKVGEQGEPQFKVSRDGYGIPTGIMGYGDVQVTEGAIYTTFEGETFKDIANNHQKGIRVPNGGNHIYVYTLEGEPLRKYELDHYVEGIWVDEKKGVILAVDGNQDEPIVEFKM